MTATNAPSSPPELSAEQKAHEPSMDDILASIRRLISDDDALPLSRRARASARSRVAAPSGEPAEAPPGGERQSVGQSAEIAPPRDAFFGLVHRLGRHSIAAAPEPAFSPSDGTAEPSEPETGQTETRREPGVSPPPASVIAKTPALKLRDFALKHFVGRPDQETPVEATAAPAGIAAPEALPAPLASEGLRPSLPTTDEPSLAPPVLSGDLKLELESAPQVSSVVALPPRPAPGVAARLKIAPLPPRAPVFETSDAKTAPEQPQEALQETPRETPYETPGALLSPASDARIGASFEALAESLLARDNNLLERAARELLRPMLKDWLDENLPSLVEGLVRAEIERIARGRG